MDTQPLPVLDELEMERIGLKVALQNILVGNLEAVLWDQNLDDWPSLLLHGITEVYRIHSWKPEPGLRTPSAGLLDAIPEVVRRVGEREALADARDALLETLPEDQRRLLER